MPGRSKNNFHVPLDQQLHERLREEARRSEQPATTIAREAIAKYLEERRRTVLREQIEGYARAVAGTSEDLDEGLEEATIDLLDQDTTAEDEG
jgi:predicted transcriptional regulator